MKKNSKHSEESLLKMRESHSGAIPWNKGTKGLSKPNSGSFEKGEHRSKNTEFKNGTPKEEHPRWKGGEIKTNCLFCKKEIYIPVYRYLLKNGNYCSQSCHLKNRPVKIETRVKIGIANRGEKSHLWKGGITPINLLLRQKLEYKLWRESVFKRDSFACQECGDSRGGNLNAHHIKQFAYFPELRLNVDNGITLCKACHKLTENYGKNKKGGVYEFC